MAYAIIALLVQGQELQGFARRPETAGNRRSCPGRRVPCWLLLSKISSPDKWHSCVVHNALKRCLSEIRIRPYEMMTLISFHQPPITPRIHGSSAYPKRLVAELCNVVSAIMCVMRRLHKANMYLRCYQLLFDLLASAFPNLKSNLRYSDLL